MIDVTKLVAVQRLMVELWHTDGISNPYRDLLQLVCEQHKFNYLLWHEEDIARSPHASDARIAGVKRAIDGYNQQRNDATERIDEFLLCRLEEHGITPAPDAQLNTETPGSSIDRLSILSLRIYHMREQTERADATREHIQRSRQKLAILTTQQEDLVTALADLLGDLAMGRKRLKLYRQFKMYNDPTLNPYLYAAPQRMAG